MPLPLSIAIPLMFVTTLLLGAATWTILLPFKYLDEGEKVRVLSFTFICLRRSILLISPLAPLPLCPN